MKILSIIIALILSSNFLLSQEEWSEFKSSMSGSFRYAYNFNNDIVVISNTSEYVVIDFETKEEKKVGKFFDGIVAGIKVIDDLLYISSLSLQGNNSTLNVFDSNYDLVSSNSISPSGGAANFIFLLEDKLYFGMNEIPNNNAMFSNSNLDLTEQNYQYIKNNDINLTKMYDMAYFDTKFYTLCSNSNLLISNNNGNSWDLNNSFNELEVLDPRHLVINEMCLLVLSNDGRNIVSFDDGVNFTENDILPIYDFIPFNSFSFENNSIIVSGYSKSTNKGYILLTKDYGENWEINLETDNRIYDMIEINDKIICQQIDGKLYSINADVISSVETNYIIQSKRVLTNGRLDYQRSFQNKIEILDLNGNIIESNIYNIYDNYIDVENLSKGFYILKEENNYLQFIKY